MSFHPNEVQRRGRTASFLLVGAFTFLASAFFRTQILEHAAYNLQSETNRLREVPLPAPRAIIYDRHGAVIAEIVRVEYDVEQAAREIVEAGLPEEFSKFLRSGGQVSNIQTA